MNTLQYSTLALTLITASAYGDIENSLISMDAAAQRSRSRQQQFDDICKLPRATNKEKRSQNIAFKSLQKAIECNYMHLITNAVQDLEPAMECRKNLKNPEMKHEAMFLCGLLKVKWDLTFEDMQRDKEILDKIVAMQIQNAQPDGQKKSEDNSQTNDGNPEQETANQATNEPKA